jgi:hypothetical protein
MLRHPSSRNYRSKRLRPRHTFQAFLLLGVGIWIVYQLSRSHSNPRAAVVEIADGGNAMNGGDEAASRRLGRKGFVGAFAGHASSDDDGIVGVGSDDLGSHGAASSDDDDTSSKAEDREGSSDGDEEELAVDGDDGADEDAGDGLARDDEDDDRDLLSRNSYTEDELKTLFGENDQATVFGNGDDDGARLVHEPMELNSSAVPRAKASGTVQDAAASQLANAADGAADGRSTSVTAITDSFLKNASPVNLPLHDKGTAGEAARKLVVNSYFAVKAAGAEDEKHNVSVANSRMINQNETDAISS